MAPRQLIGGAVPLTVVPGLTPSQRDVLAGLWIGSAQELVGIYGTNEPTRGRLAAALDINRARLDPLVNAAQRLIPLTRDASSAALELETLRAEYEMGALLDESPEATRRAESLPPYAPVSRSPLPESVSLLDRMPPLRGQGERSSCVAFAALAVREGLEMDAGARDGLDLSEQYVYWWCKQRDGLPGRRGTYLSLGLRCLIESGAPLEALWPYNPTTAGSEDQGPPPPSAASGDPAFRTAETQEFNRLDLTGMKTCLTEGRSLAVSLPVFDSWFKSSAMKRWGKITLPLAGEPVREGHAVALVGYQDDESAPGGGYFLVRNSWQPWAWEGAWAPGYGYIPYAYVTRHAHNIYSARRIKGARVTLRDANGQPATGAMRNSPDVWLRQFADAGREAQPPLPGRPNAVYGRVFNAGPACAYGVTVEVLCVAENALAPVGRLQAAMVWPGETLLGPLMWTPPGPGPFEFVARVSSASS